jgi:N-acetyl-anhydromuramyl-L-alanine amidase AmpD
MNKPTVVITHHAVSQKTHTVNDVDNWHRQRWPGFVSRAGYHVGYHYVIDWSGKVTQTREHDETGAHTLGMNNSSIGVCFMGNFDLHTPSEAQIGAWNGLYDKLRELYPNIPTRPHRAYANKSCHGKLLSDDYFAKKQQIFTLTQEVLRLTIKLLSLLRKRQ